jgi:uncharacterized protein
MIVVSDTSAITSLIQIGKDRLLAELFARVMIPTAVQRELLQYHEELPAFLEVAQVLRSARVRELSRRIDQGEAEAIALAEENSPDFLLVDDRAAREIAIAGGLPVIGLVGVVIEAKRRNLISAIKPVIEDLQAVAGFRISPGLKELALRSVAE